MNWKAQLAFAGKVVAALVIINAIINVAEYFGFGIVNSIVYNPLKTAGLNKAAN